MLTFIFFIIFPFCTDCYFTVGAINCPLSLRASSFFSYCSHMPHYSSSDTRLQLFLFILPHYIVNYFRTGTLLSIYIAVISLYNLNFYQNILASVLILNLGYYHRWESCNFWKFILKLIYLWFNVNKIFSLFYT